MPKSRLSQCFLFDPSILRKIIDAAGLLPDDTVLEIGPGPGRLTRMLAERVKEVIAIELDRRLYNHLQSELDKEEWGNIRLVNGDALKFPYETLEAFKVVANIPYHITTPLIFKLLESKKNLLSMTLTLQKEVAVRIAAKPGGGKDYGILSIALQYHGRPKLKFIIPRGAFRPVPRVDSACLHIDIYREPPVSVKDERVFFHIVKTAFSQRRKTISNSLKDISPEIKNILNSAGIDPKRRPETLSLEEFARLANYLYQPSGRNS